MSSIFDNVFYVTPSDSTDITQITPLDAATVLQIIQTDSVIISKLTLEDIEKLLAIFETIDNSDYKFNQLLQSINIKLMSTNW